MKHATPDRTPLALPETTVPHPLRSGTTMRPRAVLVAAVGITTLLLAGPAAAGCGPLDERPTDGVPATPDAPVHEVLP